MPLISELKTILQQDTTDKQIEPDLAKWATVNRKTVCLHTTGATPISLAAPLFQRIVAVLAAAAQDLQTTRLSRLLPLLKLAAHAMESKPPVFLPAIPALTALLQGLLVLTKQQLAEKSGKEEDPRIIFSFALAALRRLPPKAHETVLAFFPLCLQQMVASLKEHRKSPALLHSLTLCCQFGSAAAELLSRADRIRICDHPTPPAPPIPAHGGRMVPTVAHTLLEHLRSVGDYNLQVDLVELYFRLTLKTERTRSAALLFAQLGPVAAALDCVRGSHFDADVSVFLQRLNESDPTTQRVFAFEGRLTLDSVVFLTPTVVYFNCEMSSLSFTVTRAADGELQDMALAQECLTVVPMSDPTMLCVGLDRRTALTMGFTYAKWAFGRDVEREFRLCFPAVRYAPRKTWSSPIPVSKRAVSAPRVSGAPPPNNPHLSSPSPRPPATPRTSASAASRMQPLVMMPSPQPAVAVARILPSAAAPPPQVQQYYGWPDPTAPAVFTPKLVSVIPAAPAVVPVVVPPLLLRTPTCVLPTPAGRCDAEDCAAANEENMGEQNDQETAALSLAIDAYDSASQTIERVSRSCVLQAQTLLKQLARRRGDAHTPQSSGVLRGAVDQLQGTLRLLTARWDALEERHARECQVLWKGVRDSLHHVKSVVEAQKGVPMATKRIAAQMNSSNGFPN